ncbi:uncharacterized protein LOC129578905 isoform X6 [Sitodiplosis mosellana]|uniref:uncharacterized protein LOC129578905 isoform X6 n=1 Tax=Sitodiplosis mosellana TaxID=263140 RepID=UPI00244480A1|nr:uncharacterized protein LOC129578905 isoform X6 [Sitodiplosis mosellana]
MSDLHLTESMYPPGWDVKYDIKTGKCYYINYLTKAMQLEDPRIRYRQLQNEHASTESIPMQTSSQTCFTEFQPLHGSPYHVYPINNHPPAVQAFQAPNTASLYNVSTSPLLTNKLQKMEMSPVMRMGSPNISRIMQHFDKTSQNGSTCGNYQETSFITQADTDAAVAKINTMFPTASDAHIRLLLKKYYNREAVVISALQVEKHPLTTPGPYSTPPLPRHPLSKKHSLITMTPPLSRFEPPTSRTASPIPARPASSCASASYGSPRVGEGFRCSPKPHSSPKMKLRYLKSIYPKAEEMLLLDILANADNNVQKASEKLSSMGYEKRDTTAPKPTNRTREEQVLKERIERENTPPLQPRLKSNEEKQKIKNQLKSRYKDVAGRIITMALDSVDYSEEKAIKILEIVMQDDKVAKEEIKHEVNEDASVENDTAPPQSTSQSVPDVVDLEERPTIPATPISSDSIDNSESDSKPTFKSPWNNNKLSMGPSVKAAKGPNEDLLLADYIAWNGANSEICKGTRSLAKGTDPTLRSNRLIQAQGSKSELCKGPSAGLAKGSIYAQLKMQQIANVKCN